jgi:RimJ/RimL family protein N-acetyltransferase
MDARQYAVADTLRDGTPVTIRAARPDDKVRITEAFRALDRDTLYRRFFSFRSEPTTADLARLDRIDFVHQVHLVVTIGGERGETVIAGGQYVEDEAGDPRTAEVAFMVEEDYQGNGLAARLLRHLAAIAREQGIVRFVADVLPENKAMLAVFAKSGLAMTERREGGVMRVELAL